MNSREKSTCDVTIDAAIALADADVIRVDYFNWLKTPIDENHSKWPTPQCPVAWRIQIVFPLFFFNIVSLSILL